MLELFFKNNQAPALNSDNLNRIISEINEVEATGIQNKARTMDLQSEIARLVIEKGGSIVQANPEEEGSENITSILIDDKVYKISIEGIGDLERRIETVETDKADELTMNTGIDISDWDRDIDPDVPVIVDKYTNYHDAVSKISQQIDVMGNRTDDLKTSLNIQSYTLSNIISGISNLDYKLKRQGNVVSFLGQFKFACQTAGTKNLASFPSELLPSGINMIEITFYDNTLDMPVAGRVGADGLKMYPTSRNTLTESTWYFSASWII